MTAPRPLMTPSILSPPTRADYPQRHLLALYANETERGSNEKRVTDKIKKKREKRETDRKAQETVHERIRERKRDMKQSA